MRSPGSRANSWLRSNRRQRRRIGRKRRLKRGRAPPKNSAGEFGMGDPRRMSQDAAERVRESYDDVLRKNGHFLGGEALQSARNATTLRWKNGQGVHHRWPVRRDERAVGRDPRARSEGPEP